MVRNVQTVWKQVIISKTQYVQQLHAQLVIEMKKLICVKQNVQVNNSLLVKY